MKERSAVVEGVALGMVIAFCVRGKFDFASLGVLLLMILLRLRGLYGTDQGAG